MYKVKIVTGKNSDVMFRQLPGGSNISKCGKYQFFIDEEIDNPDFLVVRNKYLKKRTEINIAPENTILLLSEPKTIINFPRYYRNQFGMLCSCQDNLKHKNIRYCNAMLSWFVGIDMKGRSTGNGVTFDNLTSSPIPEKKKLISVITSNKAFTQGHQDRIEFVKKLKSHYGDMIEIFGRGFNDFEDKWDVLAPYKYHIAIENSSTRHYWTEKLSDCFLAGAYPIYYGAPNADEYFAKGSFSEIDIYDFDNAVRTIDSLIAEDAFENSQQMLNESKQKVLNQYNIFDYIANCCDQLDPKAPKRKITLRPAITMLDFNNFYRQVFGRNIFKAKRFLKGLHKPL